MGLHMLKLVKFYTVGLCASIPMIANADWTGDQQIVELYVHRNVVVVKLTAMVTNLSSCADTSYLTLEPDPGSGFLFKEKYAMLLAARSSGQKVDVAVDGCGTLEPMHPKIVALRMK